MNVLPGTTAPFLAARDKLQFDDALGAEREEDAAVAILARIRQHDAGTALERRENFGVRHDLAEMRRADLFLAFGHEHEVQRQLLPGGLERHERAQEGVLWS